MPILYKNIITNNLVASLTENFDFVNVKKMNVPEFTGDPIVSKTLFFKTVGAPGDNKKMRDATISCLTQVEASEATEPDSNTLRVGFETHEVGGVMLYFKADSISANDVKVFVGDNPAPEVNSWSTHTFASVTEYGEAKIKFEVSVTSGILEMKKTWFIKATCKTKKGDIIIRITALEIEDFSIQEVIFD